MMIANYGRSTLPMLMGLGGTAEITKLQQSLVNLAQATNKPQLNPGRVDGVLDDATMASVASAFSYAAGELPSTLSSVVQLALIGGSGTSTAKNYVSQYATQLSVAFNAAAIKYRTAPPATTPVVVPTASGAWYTTWWGIGGIILAGALAFKFFLAPRQ